MRTWRSSPPSHWSPVARGRSIAWPSASASPSLLEVTRFKDPLQQPFADLNWVHQLSSLPRSIRLLSSLSPLRFIEPDLQPPSDVPTMNTKLLLRCPQPVMPHVFCHLQFLHVCVASMQQAFLCWCTNYSHDNKVLVDEIEVMRQESTLTWVYTLIRFTSHFRISWSREFILDWPLSRPPDWPLCRCWCGSCPWSRSSGRRSGPWLEIVGDHRWK